MKKSIVIEKAFKYTPGTIGDDIPNVYIYDEVQGYWINSKSKTPMMFDNNGPRPQTKKQDVETGEDQKGE
ncbi:MAG: hypothetical protein A2057_15710 [Ignavibacteria bacterium GWA2_35_9]|nr:MAG: hypothetical protein A2437_08395 [Bacteroidetes bacterium RIFOXYC2_FULL_40_12]OGU33022.1 MAG: hypothetical protein A2057_15710 [Ignavibacteria bacterium GWA2_35_9]OGU44913.1 MAG: hypothetical protein A2000_07390 [Ignavibacteria bacterium GWB2_36_8]OGU51018.1 MAG: hypothetical protein A2080_08850 [Ignavibacteria bacterium GWC2_36_12]